MRRQRSGTPLPLVILVTFHICAAFAGPFAGGSGTQENPYQIGTSEQLIGIGLDNQLLDKNFVLVADIDLSGVVFTQAVIAPRQAYPIVFAGSFDGAGHAISNLTIYSDGEYCGLFGQIASRGIVCNLNLQQVTVVASKMVGGLAGISYGTIKRCHVSGVIEAFDGRAGGLAGHNAGKLEESSFSGTVRIWGETILAGGLLAVNTGSVTSCSSNANVDGWGQVGGLVGWNRGVIGNCYCTGRATACRTVGGLVALLSGVITTSFSTCSVQVGDMEVGGLVARKAPLEGRGSLAGSSPTQTDGGRTEPNDPIERLVCCYFLSEFDGGGPDNGIGTALTYAQMQQKESFTGFDFWDDKDDGPRDHWFMPTGSPPVLVWQTDMTGLVAVPQVKGMTIDQARGLLETAGFSVSIDPQGDYDRAIPPGYVLGTSPAQFAKPAGKIALVLSKGPYDWSTNPGDGTSQRPYQISTPGQLESLLDHPELYDRHFIQTADIDMAGREYSTALIAPDTNDLAPGFQGTPFAGSFDGNGFKIIGLAIRTRARTHLGAFGFIGKDGIIIRLCLINALIIGDHLSDYMGTVAGCNSGTIESCVGVLGWVVGGPGGRSAYVGPLIGQNLGTTKDCQQLGVQLIPCYE